MALKESEAIVLRTYPLREADLLVTLFTRAEGKVCGVGQEVEAAIWRGAGAAHLRSGLLRRSRAARTGPTGFLRSAGIPPGDGSELSEGGGAGARGGVARRIVAGS